MQGEKEGEGRDDDDDVLGLCCWMVKGWMVVVTECAEGGTDEIKGLIRKKSSFSSARVKF